MNSASKIDIFGSKTRPVKINVYGSDGHRFNFLLKYGDQDQRIQQIFKVLSDTVSLQLCLCSTLIRIILSRMKSYR